MDKRSEASLLDQAESGLRKTKNDDEQWSFLFRTEGSVDLSFREWASIDEEEFTGELDGLDLPWPKQRKEEIEHGAADPTEKELAEWRRARWRAQVEAGSDDFEYKAEIIWIVPVSTRTGLRGWVTFSSPYERDPQACSAHDTLEDAVAALRAEGWVSES
jgi:hypothetical protein